MMAERSGIRGVAQSQLPVRVGVSACLLGAKVRYDGGDKHDPLIADGFAACFELVPVCPEVEFGLPVPRETLQLVGAAQAPRLVFSDSGRDITEAMTAWAQQRVAALARAGVCGFIFKSRSPSCGLQGVRLCDAQGASAPLGVGLFAAAMLERFPLLPLIDDEQLHDPVRRRAFVAALHAVSADKREERC